MKRVLSSLIWVAGIVVWISGCSSPPSVVQPIVQGRPVSGSSPSDLKDVEGFRERGYAYYRKGDFLRAITQFENYLVFKPQTEDKWSRYLLYYCYMAIGQYEKALSLSVDLVKAKPYLSLGYLQVGLAQLSLGQVKWARDSFLRAATFDSSLARTQFYLGLAYERLNNKNERDESFRSAQKQYEEILKQRPQDFLAGYELASLLLYWEKSVEKVPALITAVREGLDKEDLPLPKDLYAKFYLPALEAKLQHRLGQPKRSLGLLLKLLDEMPAGLQADLAEVYYFIGLNYSVLGQKSKAETFLGKAMETDPTGIFADKAKEARQIVSSRGRTSS